MDRLVNSDKANRVQELVNKRANSQGVYADDYKQAAPHIKGRLEYEDINSGGTSYQEALEATVNTEDYVLKQKLKQFISSTYSAMMSGALAGAFVGGGTAIFQQGVKVISGEQDYNNAIKEVGKSTAKSATRSAVISGIAHGIKFIGKDSVMMKGNVAVALASSAVRLTELTYQYIKGKITIEEYLEEIGENAVSTFSGIVLSAAGSLLFGPVGAAAAATVAMIGMKQMYQAFIRVREDLRMTIHERQQAEMLSELLISKIKAEKEQLVFYYKEASDKISNLTSLVNIALEDETKVAYTLHKLATQLKIEFKYNTQEEFDEFMLSEDSLKL
jgi:hypothetical protein